MHPDSRVLWGCSAPTAILPRSPPLCQNGCLSVLSSIGQSKKSKVGRRRKSRWFRSKAPWWKRKFERVRFRNATASSFIPKARGEVFAHFHAVSTDCRTYQDECFVIITHDIKESDEHSLDFALILSRIFQSWWFWTFGVRLMFSSQNAGLIGIKVSVALLSAILKKIDAHSLWYPSRNCIRPDSRLRMKGRKN
jgi:hypothetical protein